MPQSEDDSEEYNPDAGSRKRKRSSMTEEEPTRRTARERKPVKKDLDTDSDKYRRKKARVEESSSESSESSDSDESEEDNYLGYKYKYQNRNLVVKLNGKITVDDIASVKNVQLHRVIKRKRGRPPKKKQDDLYANKKSKKNKGPVKLYCICQQPERKRDDRFFIACDLCAQWFHGDCVGVKQHRVDPDAKWYCPSCVKHRARQQEDKETQKARKRAKDRDRRAQKKAQLQGSIGINHDDASLYEHENYFDGVACVCKVRDPDNTLCVGCDGGCEGWYHGPCYGIVEEAIPESFICPKCMIRRERSLQPVKGPRFYHSQFRFRIPSTTVPRPSWSPEELMNFFREELKLSDFSLTVLDKHQLTGHEFYFIRESDLTEGQLKMPVTDTNKVLRVLAEALDYARKARVMLAKYPQFQFTTK